MDGWMEEMNKKKGKANGEKRSVKEIDDQENIKREK